MDVLKELYNVVVDRIGKKPQGSYTAYLASMGKAYVARKVGEESLEVIIASLTESKDRLVSEAVDLLYHLIVLLVLNNVSIDEVYEEILRRRK
jgi:phosphoribosyl-ATP pyrophosphohydrolase